MFNSDCETIVIFKKRDEIIYESSKCFCLFKNIEIRSVKNLKEIHIVVCGAAKSKKIGLWQKYRCILVGMEIISCSRIAAKCSP